jgi:hypothetical protein
LLPPPTFGFSGTVKYYASDPTITRLMALGYTKVTP